MKQIEANGIVIERETYNRFEDIVRGYKVNESGEPVAFLGKYIVTSNHTDEEIIKLF